jgi:hypothetical protein
MFVMMKRMAAEVSSLMSLLALLSNRYMKKSNRTVHMLPSASARQYVVMRDLLLVYSVSPMRRNLILNCSKILNNASDDAVSEEATNFTFPHGPVMHAHRSIKLTNEKGTHVPFILYVREAIVHWHDERSEINSKKQDALINKYNISL